MLLAFTVWEKSRWVWAISLSFIVLIGASTSEAKRIKIKKSEITSAEDSLSYYLEPFPYRIAPGDELMIDYGVILDGRSVTARAKVRPDGAVTLPRIGDVLVAGMSTTEVDSVLADLYADVYIDPNITTAVENVAGNKVHVLGQVRRAGSYEMMPNLTALQAVALAGGFKDDASKGSVVILRRTGENSLLTKKIDLDSAIKRGRASQDVYLRRYDIVYVNRNAIGDVNLFVDRFFTKMLPVASTYIRGWEVFNLDRVFPSTSRIIVEN